MPKDRKRKDVPAEEGSLFDAEDDAPPAAQIDVSPEQVAKKAFLALMADPVPEAKRASGGGGTVSAEGIVLRAANIVVDGKTGKVPKKQLTIALTNVMANGAKNVISPGVDGIHYLLPTRNIEASPEEIAANRYAKGTSLLDIQHGNSKAIFLGVVSCSFYIEAAGDKSDKNKSVDSICPGMTVIVNNISAAFGKTGDALFFNAKSVTPLTDVVPPGDAARAIIAESMTQRAMASATFLWSTTMGGFQGLTYSDPAHQQQADVLSGKWKQLVEGSTAKVEALALSLGSDAALSDTVTSLSSHASRIKDISPGDAAGGAQIFYSDLQKDLTTPYMAPLVQKGLTPGSAEIGYLTGKLFDADQRGSLPSAFTEAKIVKVEVSSGNLCELMLRQFWIADRAAAGAAIASQANPILYSHRPSALVKISKRTLGSELYGCLVTRKVDYLAKELLPYTDMALFASIFPRGPDDATLSGHFANMSGVDVVSGIKNVGILVSDKWIDKTMLGGRGVMIFQPLDGEQMLEPTTSAVTPVISKNYYQALSESSWDVDSLKVPAGKNIEFRVVYDGCAANVKNTPEIANAIDAGEAHLMDLIPSLRDDNDAKAFLKEDATVYAIAF